MPIVPLSHRSELSTPVAVLRKDEAQPGKPRMLQRERARDILASGNVRLLSAVWLIAQDSAYVVQRMQDLPAEAFVGPERAVNLFDQDFAVVVVSYGWLSRRHPDPTGFHTRTIQKYLKKHKAVVAYLDDCGVFWDFASMPQAGPNGAARTEQEQLVFDAGVGAVASLYSDKKTAVVQLTRMPPEAQLLGVLESNLTPYKMRGWCFFEAAVAGLLKHATMLLDLGLGAEVLEREAASWRDLWKASAGERLPPVSPEDMAVELKRRRFSYSGDAELVAKEYGRFFSDASPQVEMLFFGHAPSAGPGWGDVELSQLARVLPAFGSCKWLNLRGNHALGEGGLAQLRAQLPRLPALSTVLLPEALRDTPEGLAFQAEWLAAGKRMYDTEGGMHEGLAWA